MIEHPDPEIAAMLNAHPDPVSARFLARHPETLALYVQNRPRYAFIGQVLDARAERGWTQRQLADAVGTTQSAIARLESGDQDPRLSTICAVCRALGIPVPFGVTAADAER